MFSEDRDTALFDWNDLGNIAMGREKLGEEVPVLFYRLFQFTLRDTLIRRTDPETAAAIFREAGRNAGMAFCRNMLQTSEGFKPFLASLQRAAREHKLGIVRLEESDDETGRMVLTIAEDLECSGLPDSNETVCEYDEGFLAGVFEAYTGKPFSAREIDCWASGGRICRFTVAPATP